MSQRIRKRIEEGFGWMKKIPRVGHARTVIHRGGCSLQSHPPAKNSSAPHD
jgi:hypothetical protein